MNLHAARILAVTLMQQHGLVGWSFKFDHARRRFGCCNFTCRVISLSRPLTFLNEEGEVRDTILHEIAHALTPKTGHGPAWKAMCVRLGAKPVRCFKSDEVVTPPKRPAPMQIGCPTCGWWADRHKRTNRKLICKKCRTIVIYRAADQSRSGVALSPVRDAPAQSLTPGQRPGSAAPSGALPRREGAQAVFKFDHRTGAT